MSRPKGISIVDEELSIIIRQWQRISSRLYLLIHDYGSSNRSHPSITVAVSIVAARRAFDLYYSWFRPRPILETKTTARAIECYGRPRCPSRYARGSDIDAATN